MSTVSKYKVILTGSSSVGKTSLCNNIRGFMFNKRIPITIGVDFMKIELKNPKKNGKQEKYEIYLWDTAGHEDFRSLTKSFYRNSQIVLLCFDLTNRKSFIELNMWLDDINSTITEPVYLCLLGLKSDLESIISEEEIIAFLEKNLITTFYNYSSKESENSDTIKGILYNLVEKYNLMIKDYTYCEELKNGIFKLDNGYVNNDYLINIDDKQKKKYCC
jgi:Ras-related protein Rab-6A